MPILNYTTGIEAEKSIAEIQKILSTHGATSILADYENGNVTALSFRINVNGNLIAFKLPSDWRPVLEVLKLQKQKNNSRIKATEDQARRVAWRIIKDWVEAQMAIVELQMVHLDQVFLPYAIVKNGQTLYEFAKQSNLLSAPKAEND
ncbi:hypothetical protein KW797_01365 [Candidatus Parcubacteria bacterium]|nr:hypothetical protein [Candidatus Parcubacteria bacterium]